MTDLSDLHTITGGPGSDKAAAYTSLGYELALLPLVTVSQRTEAIGARLRAEKGRP